jgi:drug/metabolite transporter (DMT)-like permease
MIGLLLFGGVFAPLLLMLGLSSSTASSTSLFENTETVATVAIAWFVFRENIDRQVFLGVAAILSGAIVLSLRGQAELSVAGAWFIAAACTCWAIDNNLTRKISGADPLVLTTIKGLVAGGINVSLACALGGAWPGWQIIGIAGVIGFFGYGVSLILFVLALRHLGTARTGAYFAVAPFIGAVLSLAILHDPITPPLVIAAILMAVGLGLQLSERHIHEHTHEELEHEHAHVHDDHHQHSHSPLDPPGEPHTHRHRHEILTHRHAHYPDLHHRHHHE